MADYDGPEYPLPEEIRKMDRDETVCKFCGVSYLIHREIKALEEKLKATEKELARYKGCEAREAQVREQLNKANTTNAALEKIIKDKDSIIENFRSEQKDMEKTIEDLTNNRRKMEEQLSIAVRTGETYKLKYSLLYQNLPKTLDTLSKQKVELEELKNKVAERDFFLTEQAASIKDTMRKIVQQHENELKVVKKEVAVLEGKKHSLESRLGQLEGELVTKETELRQLRDAQTQAQKLQQEYTVLERELHGVQAEMTQAVSRSRTAIMEAQQFKEQLGRKTHELENATAEGRRKEQDSDLTITRLQKDVKQKENEITALQKKCQNMKKKCEEQERIEEEIQRKVSISKSETQEMKDLLGRTTRDLEALKAERELMITAHQNRIEQLRESFKQKMAEAQGSQEKMDEELQKERQKHEKERALLEEKLKENFVMELQIEKQKQQELFDKHRVELEDSESKIRSDMKSLTLRHKQEIRDIEKQATESRARSQDSEASLRDEIKSLKHIISDLENRLGRLDAGNEEELVKLRCQVRQLETDQELAQSQLRSVDSKLSTAKEEIRFLQNTVRQECEERFELTEALSEAKEQLLQLRKPAGGYHTPPASSPNNLRDLSRKNSLASLKANGESEESSQRKNGVSIKPNKMPHPPSLAPPNSVVHTANGSREHVNSNDLQIDIEGGERAKTPGKFRGTGMTNSRKRIAVALGKR